MRRLGAALCALATLLLLGALPAHAADISKDAIAKGKKEAPAAVQKAGVACTVVDAYYIGQVNSGGKQDAYEVACQQGSGYVILSGDKGSKVYDCLATVGQSLACKLPENADPKQGLKPYIASAGITCTPTNARWIGANSTTSVFEVACQEGPGYILQVPAAGAATASAATQAIPCAQLPPGGQISCTLTSKAQSDAMLAQLVTQAHRTCQISGSRFMGSNPSNGDAYYEVGCGAEPGFVIAAKKTGGLDRIVSCTEAKAIGGCTLTDPAKVAAAETASYTQKAKAAGFDCDVSKYRPIGRDQNQNDIVELACSNRPDGAVAVFPTTAAGHVQILDCIRSQEFGANGACTLTTPTPLYAKYTALLAAKVPHNTCTVTGAHYIGRNSIGDAYVETACSDGKPGFVLQLGAGDQLKTYLTCGQAKEAGVACTMPTNIHH